MCRVNLGNEAAYMKLLFDDLNETILNTANIFNINTKLNGKYKMLFDVKSRLPDSDGETIVDAYLIPMDSVSFASLGDAEQNFLHIQLLSPDVPEQFWGYEYTFYIEHAHTDDNKVEISISKLDWKDRSLSDTLFSILNTNLSHAC